MANNLLKKQASILGDDRVYVPITFETLDKYNGGNYNFINKNITLNDNNKNDFNEIMSVIIHEGGGHSFQDNVLVNNNDRIMKDSFYNSSPTGYKFGNNELDYSIYRLDPAERDAWKFQYGVMKGIGE